MKALVYEEIWSVACESNHHALKAETVSMPANNRCKGSPWLKSQKIGEAVIYLAEKGNVKETIKKRLYEQHLSIWPSRRQTKS